MKPSTWRVAAIAALGLASAACNRGAETRPTLPTAPAHDEAPAPPADTTKRGGGPMLGGGG
jgi:hypothetical protein